MNDYDDEEQTLPDRRCEACGETDPKVIWLKAYHVGYQPKRYVPVSECCEARIIDADGHELRAEDLDK